MRKPTQAYRCARHCLIDHTYELPPSVPQCGTYLVVHPGDMLSGGRRKPVARGDSNIGRDRLFAQLSGVVSRKPASTQHPQRTYCEPGTKHVHYTDFIPAEAAQGAFAG